MSETNKGNWANYTLSVFKGDVKIEEVYTKLQEDKFDFTVDESDLAIDDGELYTIWDIIWDKYLSDLSDLSKVFPNVILKLVRETDEYLETIHIYFKNGLVQQHKIYIPEFDENAFVEL